MIKSKKLVYLEMHENNPNIDHSDTLEQFIRSHDYSELFRKAYLVRILTLLAINSGIVLLSDGVHITMSIRTNDYKYIYITFSGNLQFLFGLFF
ncbi:hypothetical protein ACOSQ2_014225 [Xanthoceras sorbifolium]